MQTVLIISQWEACRLKALVKDGKEILKRQGRTQRGIDAYTTQDLDNLERALDGLTAESPKYANSTNF
jgi:hypothetical protein